MKASDIISIFGAFCMAFGGTLKSNGDSKALWWVGEAMSALGPILMASRAFSAGSKNDKDNPQEPINPTPEARKIV